MTTYRIEWQGPFGAWIFLSSRSSSRLRPFETRSAERVLDKAQATASTYRRPARVVVRVEDKGRWQHANMILDVVRCERR